MKVASVITFLALIALLYSCKHDPSLESDVVVVNETDTLTGLTYVDFIVPEKFPEIELSSDNPLSEEGIALGRRLYYDPILSKNGPMEGNSCSSCHIQSESFCSDGGGVQVLPHVNLAWSSNYLWNGKIEGSLENIMEFEVEEFFKVDLSVLQNDQEYQQSFEKVFRNPQITHLMVAKALAQFFTQLTSSNSKFDKYLRHEIMLNEEEINGFIIFNSEKGDCFHCHPHPLFTDNQFHNNGLDSVLNNDNLGKKSFTNKNSDWGLFKTPTLRNIALTAPYMHDGRYSSLMDVIDHYNEHVQVSGTLDPIMNKANWEFGLKLSQKDKDDLVTFLHTLTDYHFITKQELGAP